MDGVKMKTGRPTTYKPEYCDLMIQMLSEGASFTEFRAAIGGVTRQTLSNWRDANPEFLDAYTKAEAIGQAYWEKRLRTEIMFDNKANAALVKLYFANRFNWHDKQQTDHTSSDGTLKPTVIELVAANESKD
jgi:hypothetical protein